MICGSSMNTTDGLLDENYLYREWIITSTSNVLQSASGRPTLEQLGPEALE